VITDILEELAGSVLNPVRMHVCKYLYLCIVVSSGQLPVSPKICIDNK